MDREWEPAELLHDSAEGLMQLDTFGCLLARWSHPRLTGVLRRLLSVPRPNRQVAEDFSNMQEGKKRRLVACRWLIKLGRHNLSQGQTDAGSWNNLLRPRLAAKDSLGIAELSRAEQRLHV